ncbi:hypothetical protein NBRC116493_02800 [Aurantivibrio infirmus]
MRAFKHISKKEESELRKLFPTFYLDELHDDNSIIKLPISLWDKWYKDIEDKENQIKFDCSDKEERERYKLFYGLAADIVREYEVYGIFYGRGGIKSVRSRTQLIEDLTDHHFFMRPLLIPSVNAIFSITWDFTAYIFCKNQGGVSHLLDLAVARGLKLIRKPNN